MFRPVLTIGRSYLIRELIGWVGSLHRHKEHPNLTPPVLVGECACLPLGDRFPR